MCTEGASPIGETQYGDNLQAGHYVQSGDAKIYYEVYGKGEPFVALHGGGVGSTYEMHQFLDSLEKTYQVIAVSTRGHGKSEIGHSSVTYEQKANDMMAAVNAVTKESFILLGFSDGAYTGYKIASMYPDPVKKFVAIGAGEQVPGLRKVIMDAKQFYKADSLYAEQQLSLMPQPERWQEYLTDISTFALFW